MSHLPDYALTERQPWGDLIIVGLKPVENRIWPVWSTLPQWGECDYHGRTPPDQIEFVESPTGDYWRHWPGDGYQCPVTLDGPFPFRLGIHAGKRWDGNELRKALIWAGDDTAAREELELIRASGPSAFGALLGAVTVTGCHHADDCEDRAWDEWLEVDHVTYCSRWAEPDVYHWKLADPEPLAEPIPMRGRQGLWRLDDQLLEEAS